jgi:hypothetical protein
MFIAYYKRNYEKKNKRQYRQKQKKTAYFKSSLNNQLLPKRLLMLKIDINDKNGTEPFPT